MPIFDGSLIKSKFFRGIFPFVGTIIAASFVLKEGRTIYYKYGNRSKQGTFQESGQLEVGEIHDPDAQENATLVDFYKEMGDKGVDQWENKRGKRTWELEKYEPKMRARKVDSEKTLEPKS